MTSKFSVSPREERRLQAKHARLLDALPFPHTGWVDCACATARLIREYNGVPEPSKSCAPVVAEAKDEPPLNMGAIPASEDWWRSMSPEERAGRMNHVCTKRCVRYQVGFWRRWYYCVMEWDEGRKRWRMPKRGRASNAAGRSGRTTAKPFTSGTRRQARRGSVASGASKGSTKGRT